MNKTISIITRWLLDEGKKSATTAHLLSGLCQALIDQNIPVDRATIGAPLLHPIAQSGYASWDTEEGGKENWFVWTPENLEMLRNSPIHLAYEKGEGVRLDLRVASQRARFGVGKDLHAAGYNAYMTFPLQFSDGTYKVLTVATRRDEGFTQDQYEILTALGGALSLALELLVQKNTAKTLVNTYIGARAGQQVLDGEIHRGDGASINAIIWFSDLRGFTTLGNTLPFDEFLGVLNTYFHTVVSSIEANGGEVLKFIGDAVLGIFPIDGVGNGAADRAVTAAKDALSAQHRKDWRNDVSFGIGLHCGEVFFGNVGSEKRLDFTVTGSAVNLASRIEGLCSNLKKSLLISKDMARLCSCQTQSAGIHDLKGFDKGAEVFFVV